MLLFVKKEDSCACTQGLFTDASCFAGDVGRLPTDVGVAQIAGEVEDPAAGECMESSGSSSTCCCKNK